jgi:hypothetical protein
MKKVSLSIPTLAILSVCITLTITPAWADDLKVFSNGSVADANDVNANFAELETRIETTSLTPGEAGAAGAQGAQGNQGFIGVTGATGAQGLPGNTGATGAMGLNGTNGAKGADGAAGEQGIQGLAGDTGAAGEQGIQGLAGDTGAAGGQGIQGLAGDTGAAGEQGIQGLAGATGSMGLNGTNGAKGKDGAAGDQGIQGLDGETGADAFANSDAELGDMLYWDGEKYLSIGAPSGQTDVFYFCGGKPTWDKVDCILYEVGDVGPAGGIIVHVEDDGLHGIEAAPEDIGGVGLFKWGCESIDVAGDFGDGLGDGKYNTLNIINDDCSEDVQSNLNAAQVADGYEVNGFDNWYLPSVQEIQLIFQVLASNGVGGIAGNESYWASSPIGNERANSTSMDDGGNSATLRSEELVVRAVRNF